MPGFKIWAPADILTAADVNDYLMEQAIIQCTSGTRPASPNNGMHIYETDTGRIMGYNGSWREATRLSENTGAVSMVAGYTDTKNYMLRKGSWGWLQLTFNRPGSSMTALTSYNVANISGASNFPGADYDFIANSNAGHTCTCSVSTAGAITVRPTTTIAAGTNVILATQWPLA